jgi:cell division protein FtsB
MTRVLKPSQLLLLVQVLLLIWLGSLLVINGVFRGQQLQGEILTQRQDNQQLDRRNSRLFSQVDALRSGDLSVIEERARKDLGMVKDEETFFIFVD